MSDDRTSDLLRPRRARCSGCRASHVLLAGTVLPRRADTTAVIGTALLASARGAGHRHIAADLARPAGTVRRWLRAVRGEHLEWLRRQAVERLARLPAGRRPQCARCGRADPADPAGPTRPGLGPGRRGHPLAAAAPAQPLRIGTGRALARPRPGATVTITPASSMTTTRSRDDHRATMTTNTTRNVRFTSSP